MSTKIKWLKWLSFLIVILIIILGVFFFVPFKQTPSDDTRMILDHRTKTYIAPICFEQSIASNWLEETTLKKVKKTYYEPNTKCTKEALEGKQTTLFLMLAEKFGIVESKWDW
ncbi:hypothetical protein PB1_12559 [Bacillus methanolicus PB1]|uniref:Uncharacterized protein n=1 Tax=Bacillus methanolicus PB1 TaxID=997296 RepID=I3DVX1_BACMT|nr:hypothetical protein [Bacillus methanolicus]EIJ78392.1 hypothetical protein PB1_12559 [Bacillus methanolicus PB1]